MFQILCAVISPLELAQNCDQLCSLMLFDVAKFLQEMLVGKK